MINLKTILGFVAAAGPWSVAFGCSCAGTATLEQRFQGADNVLVAEITGCAPDAHFRDGYCGSHGWIFKTVEDLKGSNAQVQRLPGEDGRTLTSCDVSLQIGESYLLFLYAGRIHYCSGPTKLTAGGANQVEVLRAYRDHKITNITNPWYFSNRDGSCSIYHELEEASIEFEYLYDVSEVAFEPPLAVRLPSKPVPVMIIRPNEPFAFEGKTRLQIGKNKVPLTKSHPAKSDKSHSFEVAAGDRTLDILEKLTEGGEVAISGTWSTPDRAAEPFRMATSASLGSSAIASFKACMAAHPTLLGQD